MGDGGSQGTGTLVRAGKPSGKTFGNKSRFDIDPRALDAADIDIANVGKVATSYYDHGQEGGYAVLNR